MTAANQVIRFRTSFLLALLVLSLASSLNAAIGKRYTFHVGDKVDMKLFAGRDSILDTIWDAEGKKCLGSAYVVRTFKTTSLEIDSRTHRRVKTIVEHIRIPDSTKVAQEEWVETDRDVFFVADGQILLYVPDRSDVNFLRDGFSGVFSVDPSIVRVNKLQNLIFLSTFSGPDAPGFSSYYAFGYCNGSTFNEIEGPISLQGELEFPFDSASVDKQSNDTSYNIRAHLWEGWFGYTVQLTPDMPHCKYNVINDGSMIFPVDNFYPDSNNRKDSVRITLYASPDKSSRPSIMVLNKSDLVEPIEAYDPQAVADSAESLDGRAQWLHVRINKTVQGWVFESQFELLGLGAAG